MATLIVVSPQEALIAPFREHFDAVRASAEPRQHLVQGRLPDAFLVEADGPSTLALVEFLSLNTGRPIVVIGRDAPSSAVSSYLEAGADAVVRDADPVAECVARLKSLTRRSVTSTPSEVCFRFGDVVLYPERRSVLRDGFALHFTRTEFNLLCVLAQNLDTVLSHRQLMSEVWGQEFLSARHYLRVYVRRVREKIEHDPNRPQLLIAFRARGYLLRSVPATEPLQVHGEDGPGHRAHTAPANPRANTYVPSLAG